MGRPRRLELPTSGTTNRRSNQLSYDRHRRTKRQSAAHRVRSAPPSSQFSAEKRTSFEKAVRGMPAAVPKRKKGSSFAASLSYIAHPGVASPDGGLLLVNRILQALASLELRLTRRFDRHRFTSTRITTC